ncbi:hypothetical protein [Nostoc sp. CMAA1605]|nr:hypothetical protein [Nostoc sp. CMAA1605]
MGTGDWGLGTGDWGLVKSSTYTPTPLHPYTPTPLHPYTPN